MSAFYNEIDPYAAQWLRNLIAAGHIAPGVVDERSIEDIRPDELAGYTQCHFFAGIGVWSRALRLAGWPDDRPVWTGSCPCQPFSAAGKGVGFDDERHLWPAFHWLISQCRPPVVFGEQVASKDGLQWLDLVQADLEGSGYANGAADLCAASVGAPHIRQRLYWVADADNERRSREHTLLQRQEPRRHEQDCFETSGGSKIDGLADADVPTAERLGFVGVPLEPEQETRRSGYGSYWASAVLIRCADGKSRPVEPSVQPLAHGVTNRVGRLRAYGNAIVPQVAQTFIEAYL